MLGGYFEVEAVKIRHGGQVPGDIVAQLRW